jgi:hypothetical protein
MAPCSISVKMIVYQWVLILLAFSEGMEALTGNPCTQTPELTILSPEEGFEDVSKLMREGERAVFFRKPMPVTLKCRSSMPIQIHLKTQMVRI